MRKWKVALEDLYSQFLQKFVTELGNSRLETNKNSGERKDRELFKKMPYSVSEINKYGVENTQDRTGTVYCVL